MTTVIRPERPDDCAAIERVNRLGFGQENEARLVAAIRHAESFAPALSLVAVRADTVVGHILFSPIQIESDHATTRALALAPMAVLPNLQRQGIGSDLVREGLKACHRLGHTIVVVVGHPDFYSRFGFTPAASHGIQAPFPVPDEAFRVLALVRGSLDGVCGVVRYPAAFDDV